MLRTLINASNTKNDKKIHWGYREDQPWLVSKYIGLHIHMTETKKCTQKSVQKPACNIIHIANKIKFDLSALCKVLLI